MGAVERILSSSGDRRRDHAAADGGGHALDAARRASQLRLVPPRPSAPDHVGVAPRVSLRRGLRVLVVDGALLVRSGPGASAAAGDGLRRRGQSQVGTVRRCFPRSEAVDLPARARTPSAMGDSHRPAGLAQSLRQRGRGGGIAGGKLALTFSVLKPGFISVNDHGKKVILPPPTHHIPSPNNPNVKGPNMLPQ